MFDYGLMMPGKKNELEMMNIYIFPYVKKGLAIEI